MKLYPFTFATLLLAFSTASAQVYDFESGTGILTDVSFGSGSNNSLGTSADGSTGLTLQTHSTNAWNTYALTDSGSCVNLAVGTTATLTFDTIYTEGNTAGGINWGFVDATTGVGIWGYNFAPFAPTEFGIATGAANAAASPANNEAATSAMPSGSYNVEFSVTSLGGDLFSVSSVVSDFTTGAVVQSYASTNFSATGLEGMNLHPVFGKKSGRNTAGLSYTIDNTLVVPEPSGAFLALLGGLSFMTRRRR